MELKNALSPWNWFKKEEEQPLRGESTLPVTREYPLGRLHQEVDQLFENFFRQSPLSPFRQMDQVGVGGLMMPKVGYCRREQTLYDYPGSSGGRRKGY